MSELLLPARLVIAEASAFRDALIAHFAGSAGEVVLDGSAVQECDTAGLQLLLSVSHTARVSQRAVRICRCSAALWRTLQLAGVTQRLGLTTADAPGDAT
jgi:anti-anti-sigma regulatory factor